MIKPTPKPQAQRNGINRNGRKTDDWHKVWRWLKPRLERAGRTKCEFWFIPHECWGPLDPAHSKKRRNMQGDDIYAVGMACRRSHDILDGIRPHPGLGRRMTHVEMEQAVLRAIRENGGMIFPKETP